MSRCVGGGGGGGSGYTKEEVQTTKPGWKERTTAAHLTPPALTPLDGHHARVARPVVLGAAALAKPHELGRRSRAAGPGDGRLLRGQRAGERGAGDALGLLDGGIAVRLDAADQSGREDGRLGGGGRSLGVRGKRGDVRGRVRLEAEDGSAEGRGVGAAGGGADGDGGAAQGRGGDEAGVAAAGSALGLGGGAQVLGEPAGEEARGWGGGGCVRSCVQGFIRS